MLLRVVLLALMALSGWAASPFKHATNQQTKALYGVPSAGDLRLMGKASVRLAHQNRNKVLAWLQRHHRVASVVMGKDGQTVVIHFRDGSQTAIVPPTLTTVSPSGVKFGSRLRPMLPTGPYSPDPTATPLPPMKRALILEPFATEQVGVLDAGPEENVLRSFGYQVDELSDQAVTLQAVANIWRYNVLYMHTHAGVNESGFAVVVTGQIAAATLNDVNTGKGDATAATNDPAIAPLIREGSVMVNTVTGGSRAYYGILPPFISRYMKQFPANSLLYIDTCNLLSGSLFWPELQKKGASVLVTWLHDSLIPDETRSAQAFFSYMSHGMPVSDAVDAVLAAGLGRSTVDGKVATLGYFGDGNITLSGRVDRPTATPTPTRTPTSGPATATPLPTATAVPPPHVNVNLKPQVAPGDYQTVLVKGNPNTPVHIRVDFPNGDQQTADAITGPDGSAVYAYVQEASKIEHNRYTAKVSVSLETKSAVTSVDGTYQIGFGDLDASVQPRSQTPGKPVALWVHAKAGTRVVVSLRLGSTKLLTFKGRAGRHNWVHHVYVVPQQPTFTKGETILVDVSARLGNALSQARTTFKVL